MKTRPMSMSIDTWVFDLDNTIYPASCNLFPSMDIRMTEYIANFLDISAAEAKKIQHKYYQKYGTTLAGLMTHHNADPHPFLDYVHEVDLSPLDRTRDIGPILSQLRGRKLIYTNGSVKHAERITKYLNIYDLFDGIYAIDTANYVPKPNLAAYQDFCIRHRVTPRNAVFFEDLSVNLKPAKTMGFETVLISDAPVITDSWVDHLTPCLPTFLEAHTP